jgi:hypothetical protein
MLPYITIPGQVEYAVHDDKQKAFTQEVRLQSAPGGRLNWVIGGFYMRSRQSSAQDIVSPYVERLIRQATGNPTIRIQDIFGGPLLPGEVFLAATTSSVDEQLAGFVQADFECRKPLMKPTS